MSSEPVELLKKKSVVAIFLILFAAVFFVLQAVYAPIFDLFIILMSLLVTKEIIGLFAKIGKPLYKPLAFLVPVLFFVLVVIGFYTGLSALWMFIISVCIMAVLYLLSLLWGYGFKKEYSRDAFVTSTGMNVNRFIMLKSNNTLALFVYPNFLLFFMYLLNHIDALKISNIATVFSGAYIALFGLILVFAISSLSDTLANLCGTFLKGPKVFPPISFGAGHNSLFYPNGKPVSPNKRWSGCIGGLIGGMIAGIVVYFVFAAIFPGLYNTVHWWQFLIVGLFGSVVSQIGDVFESYLKRRAGVVDAGTLLKSHGGVVDRIDAIIFNTPFIFVCLLLIL